MKKLAAGVNKEGFDVVLFGSAEVFSVTVAGGVKFAGTESEARAKFEELTVSPVADKPVSKSDLVSALRALSVDRRRQIGNMLGVTTMVSNGHGHKTIASSNAQWIAEGILASSMTLKEQILKANAVCSILRDEKPFARLMCRLTFHSFDLVVNVARAQRGMRKVGA